MGVVLNTTRIAYSRRANLSATLTMFERAEVLRGARVISRRMVRNSKKFAPIKTGRLRRSITGGTRDRKRSAILHLSATTPYAVYVEAGYPNIRTKWFLRKPFTRFYPVWRDYIVEQNKKYMRKRSSG